MLITAYYVYCLGSVAISGVLLTAFCVVDD